MHNFNDQILEQINNDAKSLINHLGHLISIRDPKALSQFFQVTGPVLEHNLLNIQHLISQLGFDQEKSLLDQVIDETADEFLSKLWLLNNAFCFTGLSLKCRFITGALSGLISSLTVETTDETKPFGTSLP